MPTVPNNIKHNTASAKNIVVLRFSDGAAFILEKGELRIVRPDVEANARRAVVNTAIAKTNADNKLRKAGVAVDGHIIENWKFRPMRLSMPAPVKPHNRKRRAISTALILLTGLLALSGVRRADANDAPAPSVAKCDSIEALEEAYPNSHFTKLSPEETTAFINKFPDPANKMVAFYAVSFPKDPHITVIHGYTINGCWAGAMQLPADAFEQVIHGANFKATLK